MNDDPHLPISDKGLIDNAEKNDFATMENGSTGRASDAESIIRRARITSLFDIKVLVTDKKILDNGTTSGNVEHRDDNSIRSIKTVENNKTKAGDTAAILGIGGAHLKNSTTGKAKESKPNLHDIICHVAAELHEDTCIAILVVTTIDPDGKGEAKKRRES